jgi:hypothetical protein
MPLPTPILILGELVRSSTSLPCLSARQSNPSPEVPDLPPPPGGVTRLFNQKHPLLRCATRRHYPNSQYRETRMLCRESINRKNHTLSRYIQVVLGKKPSLRNSLPPLFAAILSLYWRPPSLLLHDTGRVRN